MNQLHKRFENEQVKQMLQRYLRNGIERNYIQTMLGVGKTRFFQLLEAYRSDPDRFSIQYQRKASAHHKIAPEVERNILKELAIDQKAIQDKNVPLKRYNYSYVRDRLETQYHQSAALSTIIAKAKKNGFYIKNKIHKTHDREVLTHYTGELIQHDSSHHLWAPSSGEKWYLITSIDDFSRFMFYAALVRREAVWTHILALQTLVLKYGIPYSLYVDSHSIFRFVRGRDELLYKHHLLTDEGNPQWRQVIRDLDIKPIYALSPQAKGKVERPYGWIQDHLVRTCIRNNVTRISEGNRILADEMHAYNYKRVHSTTEEVPFYRFQRALREKQSLFREFMLIPPFKSFKDIFCFRIERTADAYRKISLNNTEFKVNGADPHDRIVLKIYPLNKLVSEIRFWKNNQLLDVHKIKTGDLQMSTFDL
jgi:hypothetical protein